MLRVYLLILILCSPAVVQATEYQCKVEKKFDLEHVSTSDEIKRGQFSVLVDEKVSATFISRCSFSSSDQKVTCDRYEVDKVIFDDVAKIKKYYVFRSQFDVQLFPNLLFMENNGRGGVAFGRCTLVAP